MSSEAMNYSNIYHPTLIIGLDLKTTTTLVHGSHTRIHHAIEPMAGHSEISNCTFRPFEKVDHVEA